jgi:pimeloyl-ACP methyl ester carboxylesterase
LGPSGLLVQAYAAAYPGEVAGVVALKPVPPWGQWSTLGFSKMTAEERRGETAYYAGENGQSLASGSKASGFQLAYSSTS